MTPHRNGFKEYEEIEGGDILLGDYLPTNIVGQGKILLMLKDERRGNLSSMFHIPGLA